MYFFLFFKWRKVGFVRFFVLSVKFYFFVEGEDLGGKFIDVRVRYVYVYFFILSFNGRGFR